MKASFKPRARLLKLLGDQLIGTPQLAIFELVKNSYDADADRVEIIINNPEDSQVGTIEVTDFGGTGMDMDTIVNIWLEPGADHKQKSRQDGKVTPKHKRLPLGEKGVGRFAVHKLGQKIDVITKAEHSPEIALTIDWNSLEDCKYIDDTEVEIEERQNPEFFTDGATGTKIIISSLNHALDKNDVRKLHRNIESIQSPFEHKKYRPHKKSSTFDVNLIVPQHPEWTSDLIDIDAIISQSLFKYTFIVENGKLSWSYEFTPSQSLQKEFKVEKRSLYEDDQFLELSGKFKKEYLAAPEAFTNDIGTILGELYVFDFDAEVRKFYSETGAVKEFLKENKGIRIYRDGIRVYNYGEPQDDWLSLDNRRVQRVSLGLNRNITVGAISLDLKTSQPLIEKTNREGFIENDAYEKLKSITTSCIGKLEGLRHSDKSRLRNITKKEGTSISPDLDNPIEELKSAISAKKLSEEFSPTIAKIERSYNEMRDIMLTAGMAGLNMSVAFHEIHRGIKDTKRIVESGEDRSIIIKQFERFELLLDTYANLLKSEKNKNCSIQKVLSNNIALAKLRFEMHDITHSCPVLVGDENDYIVNVPQQLLTSAINNLIDNSIHWLDQRWGNETESKYIYVGVSNEFDKGPAIIVADNGVGWRNISPQEAVKPFMTTKAGGMGIGLFYTNTLMEKIGGELVLLSPKDVEVPEAADGAVAALVFNGGELCKK